MFFRKKETQDFEQFYQKFFNNFKKEGETLLCLLNFFSEGVIFLDEKQKIALINPEAEKILQVKNNDVFGKSILYLGNIPNIYPLIPFLAEQTEKTFKKEIEIQKNLLVLMSVTPIFSNEKLLGTIVLLKNITQEKLLERAKTDFVTLAAHQFRTPTSAIKWSLSIILEQSSNLTEEQKLFLKKTIKTNNRMIDLINNLLDFKKTETGMQLLKPALFQIEDLIFEIIKENKERIEKKQLKLIFEKPDKLLPKLMIDPTKLKIAIENILDNAIRYTKEKGLINIYFEKKENEISVYFQDNGVGIPENQQNNVFSHFFRGSNIVQIHTEGIGLGLFLAKSIIKAHGGKIWFKSKEGQGSLFAFSLPIKENFEEFITRDFY